MWLVVYLPVHTTHPARITGDQIDSHSSWYRYTTRDILVVKSRNCQMMGSAPSTGHQPGKGQWTWLGTWQEKHKQCRDHLFNIMWFLLCDHVIIYYHHVLDHQLDHVITYATSVGDLIYDHVNISCSISDNLITIICHDIQKSPWRQKYVKSTSWPLTNSLNIFCQQSTHS